MYLDSSNRIVYRLFSNSLQTVLSALACTSSLSPDKCKPITIKFLGSHGVVYEIFPLFPFKIDEPIKIIKAFCDFLFNLVR